jgi:hypothetical protein
MFNGRPAGLLTLTAGVDYTRIHGMKHRGGGGVTPHYVCSASVYHTLRVRICFRHNKPSPFHSEPRRNWNPARIYENAPWPLLWPFFVNCVPQCNAPQKASGNRLSSPALKFPIANDPAIRGGDRKWSSHEGCGFQTAVPSCKGLLLSVEYTW